MAKNTKEQSRKSKKTAKNCQEMVKTHLEFQNIYLIEQTKWQKVAYNCDKNQKKIAKNYQKMAKNDNETLKIYCKNSKK